MDTSTIRMLEGRLKSAMASVGFWGVQHFEHCDTSSFRCYREALVRALTTAQILDSLHIEGGTLAVEEIEAMMADVKPPLQL